MQKLIEKAAVLIEALPYIRKFHHKTVIIKYGGSALSDIELRKKTITDVVFMKFAGLNPVIVHGGGPLINKYLKKRGKNIEFIEGLRVTDKEIVKIVEQALVEDINKNIIGEIKAKGADAVTINGADKGHIIAEKYFLKGRDGRKKDIGLVGEVKGVGKKFLKYFEDPHNPIPVISPLGRGKDGKVYNINADHVAGAIAVFIKAEKLILLTDVNGILRRIGSEEFVIPTLGADKIKDLIEEGIIQAGMIPKVSAALKAVNAGVGKSHIINGRIDHALLLEIFTDKGIGTEIVA
jgi:acetylglutamate kinase